jgi:hypothetical protein
MEYIQIPFALLRLPSKDNFPRKKFRKIIFLKNSYEMMIIFRVQSFIFRVQLFST